MNIMNELSTLGFLGVPYQFLSVTLEIDDANIRSYSVNYNTFEYYPELDISQSYSSERYTIPILNRVKLGISNEDVCFIKCNMITSSSQYGFVEATLNISHDVINLFTGDLTIGNFASTGTYEIIYLKIKK